MGSLTIQVIGDASVGTKTKTWNYSDADINRLVAYCKATYPVVSASGVTSVPTVTQALQSWAEDFRRATEESVQQFETVIPAKIVAT